MAGILAFRAVVQAVDRPLLWTGLLRVLLCCCNVRLRCGGDCPIEDPVRVSCLNEHFFVQGAEEPFDLAVGLRTMRAGQPVFDSKAAAASWKARLPLRVVGAEHTEDQIVVGQDDFDSIKQGSDDLFQKSCGILTGTLNPATW